MPVRPTSIETYQQIVESDILSEKRLNVYTILYKNGALTGGQVSEKYKSMYPTNTVSETVRNRITELVKMGVVEEVGLVDCPVTNRRVMLFQTNNNYPVPFKPEVTLKQKVTEIKNRVVALGKIMSIKTEVDELRKIYYLIENLEKK